MGIVYDYFGKDCGKFKLLIRFATLPGELLGMVCPQNTIWFIDVLVDGTYEECGTSSESLLHLFWECRKAKEMRVASKLFCSLPMVHFQSCMDFLWFLLMEEKRMKEKSTLVVTLVWAHWTNRMMLGMVALGKMDNICFNGVHII